MEDNIIILLFIAIGLIKTDGVRGIIFMAVVHVYICTRNVINIIYKHTL